MAGLRIFESSGYVSPKVMGIGSPEDFQHDRWFAGDDDATVYHTLIGITGLKVANPAKIIEILKKAKYLFGDIHLDRFFQVNVLRNQFYSDLHYEFLEDTINYIRTGKRKMNIRMWQQLLSVKRGKLSKKYTSKTAYSMKPECYRHLSLQQWVSPDDGLMDLVYTLYIIFGKYTAWE